MDRVHSLAASTVFALLRPDRAAGERAGHPRAGRGGGRLGLRDVHPGAASRAATIARPDDRLLRRPAALASVLMSRNPMFFIFAITGFFHAALLRPWPLTVAGVAATSDPHQHGRSPGSRGGPRDLWFLYGAIIVIQIIAIGFGTVLGERLSELSEQRRQARRPAPGRHGRERRAPAPARRAGAGGRRARRASPHGARDPRHHRPRPDRHRHPAGGGRAGQRSAATTGDGTSTTRSGWRARAWSEARRSVEASRPEVAGGGDASRTAWPTSPQRWSAINGVPVEFITTGDRAAAPSRDRGGPAADRPGSAGQRRQARRRVTAPG